MAQSAPPSLAAEIRTLNEEWKQATETHAQPAGDSAQLMADVMNAGHDECGIGIGVLPGAVQHPTG
jgi:hypothetical protein